MNVRKVAVLMVLALFVNGCTLLGHERKDETLSSSSLVDFLYPYGAIPPSENSIPQLRVPLRVGLAFLPQRKGESSPVTAAEKEELLKLIRARFQDRKFVREIVVLPDYYLQSVRGFQGLEGVQRLYGIDLMALVSYDQVTHQDDNKLSLGYITIVGAYVLKGSRHDTTTLVDLAVVDPGTLSIVLRAGGTDTRHGNTALIDQERKSREAASHSFAAATGQLIENFDRALVAFEADVRAGKANVRVAQRNAPSSNVSGGGVGAMTWPLFAMLLPVPFLRRRRAR